MHPAFSQSDWPELLEQSTASVDCAAAAATKQAAAAIATPGPRMPARGAALVFDNAL